ncbi:MAG: hypothetical protein ACKO96_04335, partial [Flammeovirgaceae bacterium]
MQILFGIKHRDLSVYVIAPPGVGTVALVIEGGNPTCLWMFHLHVGESATAQEQVEYAATPPKKYTVKRSMSGLEKNMAGKSRAVKNNIIKCA